MSTISIEEVQARLPELIGKLAPGDEIIITQNARPIAELRPIAAERSAARYGSCQGTLTIVADDEEHLEDFREYMP
jgi:antitoxin (DNA-binding transcriptional repressor) of toxin-antitoxin stability system